MSFYMPPVQENDFELCPEGSHIAVCYRVVDLGTQQSNFGAKHQILISWEMPDELMNDGRPFSIGKKYTYSSHEKSNLRKDLESWRGAPFRDEQIAEFDIAKLIGAGCMIGVTHKDGDKGTFANVTAILRLPKGTAAPPPMNEALCFNLADRPFDNRAFGKLSERLQNTIKQSPEYDSAIAGRDPYAEPETWAGPNSIDDDIPF